MTITIHATTKALIDALARDRRARDEAALADFHDDVAAMSRTEFVALLARNRRADARRRRGGDDAASAAYDAADRARRLLLVTARRLIPMLAARLSNDSGVELGDLPATERRSLVRFVKAASRRAGEPAVIAAADALVDEHSMARDIL